MAEESSESNSKINILDEDDAYRESEDEDFVVEASTGRPQEDEDSSSDEYNGDDDDEKNLEEKYKSIQGTGEESLIKTRSQRTAEGLKQKEYKAVDTTTSKLNVDALWEMLNSTETTTDKAPQSELPEEEYIVIQRKYQFAGKVAVEEKKVLASSAEAKAYQAEQVELANKVSDKSVLPKKKPMRKKKSTLEAELNSGKVQKMNMLQKSRLDWASFVDKEGIKDDLSQHNKGGYLHKQDFLSRVENRLDASFKEAARKAK